MIRNTDMERGGGGGRGGGKGASFSGCRSGVRMGWFRSLFVRFHLKPLNSYPSIDSFSHTTLIITHPSPPPLGMPSPLIKAAKDYI